MVRRAGSASGGRLRPRCPGFDPLRMRRRLCTWADDDAHALNIMCTHISELVDNISAFYPWLSPWAAWCLLCYTVLAWTENIRAMLYHIQIWEYTSEYTRAVRWQLSPIPSSSCIFSWNRTAALCSCHKIPEGVWLKKLQTCATACPSML